MTNQIVVSLGSNIDREKNLPQAVELLRKACRVIKVSAVYETMPVGKVEQDCFFNAAILVQSNLDPKDFRSKVLAEIEKSLGRVRTADKNAARTIDADLSLFNDESFDLESGHHIPDPDILRFPHVAVPIAEICPNMVHPETGEVLSVIAERLMKKQNSTKLRKLAKKELDLSLKKTFT